MVHLEDQNKDDPSKVADDTGKLGRPSKDREESSSPKKSSFPEIFDVIEITLALAE
jgi:hypothetical protein